MFFMEVWFAADVKLIYYLVNIKDSIPNTKSEELFLIAT